MGAERIKVDGVPIELDSVTAMEVHQVSDWLHSLMGIDAITSDQYRSIRRGFVRMRLHEMGRAEDVAAIDSAGRPDAGERPREAPGAPAAAGPGRMLKAGGGLMVRAVRPDDDALAIVGDLDSDFARDLACRARGPKGLTEGQWAWVHKLANEAGDDPRTAALADGKADRDRALARAADEPLESTRPARPGKARGNARYNPKSSSGPGPGNRRA